MKKSVDKCLRRWYYSQAVARSTAPQTVRTLKIKQCKTRTKTHTIPVNSYSELRRIRKQEIVFKTDAKERHELQTQTMISTTERLC